MSHCFFPSFDLSHVQTSAFCHQAFCILTLFEICTERDFFLLRLRPQCSTDFLCFHYHMAEYFVPLLIDCRQCSLPFLSVHSFSCASVSPFTLLSRLVPFFLLSSLGLTLLTAPLSFLLQAAIVIGKLANHIVC